MNIVDTGLLYKTDLLKKLILENPDLPLLVFAGEEAYNSDFGWTSCSCVSAEIGEVLDADTEFMDDDGMLYTDRIRFEEDFGDWYYTYKWNDKGTDAELDAEIEQELKKFEPYWKKCIILFVNN